MNCSDSSLTGRPVRIVSVAFPPGRGLESIAEIVDAEGARGADLIVLPETIHGLDASLGTSPLPRTCEPLDGPTIRAFSKIARQCRTYIVCGIDRIDHDRRFNSAVLIDRDGEIAHVYDKMHPVWHFECRSPLPVFPGNSIAVCETDFGRIGIAVCFDVNWPGQWRCMGAQGAELVIWPSAYSGGRALQSHAVQNHFYIVSSTWAPDCTIYDIDGEEIAFDCNNRGQDLNVTRATLDLDRCIFHFDLNNARLAALLHDHAADLIEDKRLDRESWFILRALRAGISSRELAARYGLQELNSYQEAADYEIEVRRDHFTPKRVRPSALAAAGTDRD